MKTVTIPSNNDPFICNINNVIYSYKAGTTQTVPDEVAALIDNINANTPKEATEPGVAGQVYTKKEKGAGWENVPVELPSGGSNGQFLKKTASGVEWGNIPSASDNAIGGVKRGAAVSQAADGTDVILQFNNLIDSLVASGAIARYEAPDAE